MERENLKLCFYLPLSSLLFSFLLFFEQQTSAEHFEITIAMTRGQLAGALCAPQLRPVIHGSSARGHVQAARQGETFPHRDLAPGSEREHTRACIGAERGDVDVRGFSMEIAGGSALPPPRERPRCVLLRLFFWQPVCSIFLACVFMSYVWFLLNQQKTAQGWGFSLRCVVGFFFFFFSL